MIHQLKVFIAFQAAHTHCRWTKTENIYNHWHAGALWQIYHRFVKSKVSCCSLCVKLLTQNPKMWRSCNTNTHVCKYT